MPLFLGILIRRCWYSLNYYSAFFVVRPRPLRDRLWPARKTCTKQTKKHGSEIMLFL